MIERDCLISSHNTTSDPTKERSHCRLIPKMYIIIHGVDWNLKFFGFRPELVYYPNPCCVDCGKKAPSGFLGMRGKKSDEQVFAGNEVDSELESLLKRAPSGFLGMRGKKAPSGFLGMRGKKAPSGFLGMRGKKMYRMRRCGRLSPPSCEQQQQKRALVGFLGMRGKKADYDEDFEDTWASPAFEKRAPAVFLDEG
nr:tachykinins-like [Penaeus vannamei]